MSQETSVILQQCRFEFASKTPFRTVDVVRQQFQFFKEMIASSTPASPAPYPQTISLLPDRTIAPSTSKINVESLESSIQKVMKFDEAERVISLTIRPNSVEDAALLILLGQKVMLSNEFVTGGAIMEGITATGGLSVTRMDRTPITCTERWGILWLS